MVEEHEQAHEHAAHEHSKKNNNMLYAIAVVALIALAAFGYMVMQSDALNARIAQNEKTQATAQAKLDSIDAKLTQVSNYVNTRLADLTVTLTLYYDSDCASCDNERMIQSLNYMQSNFSAQGITLNQVDISGKQQTATDIGVDRVPALYASNDDLNRGNAGTYLNNFINQFATPGSGFDYYQTGNGIALTPIMFTEMLTQPCLSDKTSIDYFSSPTCEYCTRVKNANGTVVNPPTDPNYATVVNEELPKVEASMNDALNVTSHCAGARTPLDNSMTLGISKSDEQLCADAQGVNQTQADASLANKYHVVGGPRFVQNCKYVFGIKAATAEEITQQLCLTKSSLPGCPAATPTATPVPTSTPTA